MHLVLCHNAIGNAPLSKRVYFLDVAPIASIRYNSPTLRQ
jgi:hypothetical protein